MSEIKTLNSHTLADTAAREAIDRLAEEIEGGISLLKDTTEELTDAIIRTETATPYEHEVTRDNYINPTNKWFFPTIISDTTIKTVKLYAAPTTVDSTITIELWHKNGDTLTSSGKKWTHIVSTGSAEGYFEVEINEPIDGEAMLSVIPGNYNVIGIGAGMAMLRTDLTSAELTYSGLTKFAAGGLLGEIITETVTSRVADPFGTLSVGGNKEYKTIQAAVDAAADGDTILVYPGVYREQVKCLTKEIHIVGLDKTSCILIDSSANYYTPPLWMNVGSVSNMTIIEDAAEPDPETPDGYLNMAYCIHIDGSTTAIGKSMRVSECILKNANRAALGMGAFKDYSIIVENCDIYSGEHAEGVDDRGAVYFHNNSSANVTGQHVSVRSNRIECGGSYSICLLGTFPGSGEFTVELINNMCWSEGNGKADASVQITSDPTVSIAPTSYGNNVAALNA